jgi:TonB family protein
VKALLCLLPVVSLSLFAQAPPVATPARGGRGRAPAPAPARVIPPPAILITQVDPEYTEEARAAGLQGTVSLFLSVNEDGVPFGVKVMHGLGLGLDEKALHAVERWRFKPGLPSVGQAAEVNFHLNEGSPWRIRLQHTP